MKQIKTIFPVILAVPTQQVRLKGREKVQTLSLLARQALMVSSEKSGVFLDELEKDEKGSPLPHEGNHWSLSHKEKYVCAVTAPEKIGIDIEEIQPRAERLFQKIAHETEWELTDDPRWRLFFRYWTSKEATLKATGTGLSGLSDCRIDRVIDDRHLLVSHMGCRWEIEHVFFNSHVASVVTNGRQTEWSIPTAAMIRGDL
jgi:4'-phosphopantetheinyl transferase